MVLRPLSYGADIRAHPSPSRQLTMTSVAQMKSSEELEVTVGDVQYILIPNPEDFLQDAGFNGDDIAPVLVYPTTPGETISRSALQDFRTNVLDRDDVFQPVFFSNVVFYGSERGDVTLEPDALEELNAWNTKTQTFVSGKRNVAVAPGPYVLSKGKTWQPWRVYYDSSSIFMTTVKPSPDATGSLAVLDASHGGTDGRVIVPSRCYYNPTKSQPLAGARITVKDNIDIAGHKTTLCNRAWADLYPEKTKTAACIQVLIDAGAVIVGKVKLQAMIMREEPLECVEYTAPFNPRADGYQVPSGSSHASAAGIASYDWLDFSVGSDTNGSGRKPASYNGCFSIRPSTGIMDTSGVVGQFPQFDMPVFFGRDISRFSKFISVWYGSSPMLRAPSNLPVKILYPLDFLPTTNDAQTKLIDKFVKGLESTLGVSRTEVSLADLWKQDLPDGPEHSDIAEYLYLAGGYPYYRDSYYDLAKFRDEYEEKFGKPPFVQRAMRWQWDIAKTITVEERNKYWRRSEVYRHWLLDRVFHADSKKFTTVMIFPIEAGKPNYRESDIPPFAILPGFASLNMAPMMRAPEITAPVGDIPYDSWVTQRQERLPIAVSVIGSPGADLILADLVEKGMKGAGLPTQVKTGRSMY
ncbi:amidase [Hypoxylon sp. FL1857]|nr:amidase [Hypoxylon sp. FL1857]